MKTYIMKNKFIWGIILSFKQCIPFIIMLAFVKRLNWSCINWGALVLSLLLLSTHSSAFEKPQHKLYLHLDDALGAPGVYPAGYNVQEYGNRGDGFGISYDYIEKRGHAFAIEYHKTPWATRGDELFYMGYRYHTQGGFHLGLGFTLIGIHVDTQCVTSDLRGRKNIIDDGCSVVYTELGLGLSLGYAYVFKSGFTFGVSGIYAPAIRGDGDVFDSRGSAAKANNNAYVGARNAGLILGYTWD